MTVDVPSESRRRFKLGEEEKFLEAFDATLATLSQVETGIVQILYENKGLLLKPSCLFILGRLFSPFHRKRIYNNNSSESLIIERLLETCPRQVWTIIITPEDQRESCLNHFAHYRPCSDPYSYENFPNVQELPRGRGWKFENSPTPLV